MAKFGGWYLQIFFKTYCKYDIVDLRVIFWKQWSQHPAGSWMFSGWWYVHRLSTASMSWILSTFRTSRSVEKRKKNYWIVPPSQVLHAFRAPLWPPHHQTELQRPSWPGGRPAPWRRPVPAASRVTARWPGCASACPPAGAPQSRGAGRSCRTNQKISNTACYREEKILHNSFFFFSFKR